MSNMAWEDQLRMLNDLSRIADALEVIAEVVKNERR